MANEQMIKFWWRSGSRMDPDPYPYRDTGKTCLGGGMHYPSASSIRCCSVHLYRRWGAAFAALQI